MMIPNYTDISEEQIETYFEGVRRAAGSIVGRGEQHRTIFITLPTEGYKGEVVTGRVDMRTEFDKHIPVARAAVVAEGDDAILEAGDARRS